MADFPSLNIWTDALIGDTQHLDNEEFGIYLRLLIVSWRTPHCELPADDALIAKYARCSLRRWEKIKATILPFFHVKNGKLRQKRLRKERLFQIKVSRAQALRAKKRWKSEKISAASNTMGEIDNSRKPLKPNNSAYAGDMPESCLPSPSPSPSLKKEKEEDLTVFQEKENSGSLRALKEALIASLEDAKRPSPGKRATRRSLIDPSWRPSEKDIRFAIDRGVSKCALEDMAVSFVSWHQGHGTMIADVSGCWRTWVMKARPEEKTPQHAFQKKSRVDEALSLMEKFYEEDNQPENNGMPHNVSIFRRQG